MHDMLQQMHATASRSDTLTTFDDFTVPPAPSSISEPKGIDLVPGGLSGLYNRLKASVGGSREPTAASTDFAAGETRSKAAYKSGIISHSPGGTSVSSPVVVSGPSSRLQSPSATAFPESLPPSRDSNISSITLSSKVSLNVSKSSLATIRSRPSIAPSIEPGVSFKDNDSVLTSPVASHSHTSNAPPQDQARNHAGKGFGPNPYSTAGPNRVDTDQTDNQPGYKRDLDLVDQESDETEDEMVMIPKGEQTHRSANFRFPSSASRETSSKVDPRSNNQHQPARSTLNQAKDQLSSVTENPDSPRITNNARTPVVAPEPQRPPLVKVGPSHLPGFHPSRASSSDGLSSIISTSTVRTPATAPIEVIQRQAQARPAVNNVPRTTFQQMRRKILDREFWMRDENAKECFKCGDTFTTWRRKHHCRTCGQIFDSKCTSVVSGKLFGQASNLRVCKSCEAIIYGHDDDSSDYTDDGDQTSRRLSTGRGILLSGG